MHVRRFRRRLALALAAALIATACGAGEIDDEAESTQDPPTTTTTTTTSAAAADTGDDADDDDSDDDGSTAEGPGDEPAAELDCSQATASDVGITEDTIRLGMTTVDLTALFGTGLVPEITPEQFFAQTMSLFHVVNENGGINCRRVELVWEAYNPANAAETQVPACERLALDQDVFAVIAFFPDSAGGGLDCLWDRFEMPVVTGGPVTEATIEESAGRILAIRPTVEAMVRTNVEAYDDLGLLQGERIAVLGGDTGELAVGRESFVAALRARGIEPLDVVLPSSGGIQAMWAQAPAVVATLVEQDVTTVIMTDSGSTMAPYFNEMRKSGADWQWLTVDTQSAGGQPTAENMPAGWRATAVTSFVHERRTSDADLECIDSYAQMRSSGQWPAEYFRDPDPSAGNTNTTRNIGSDCALAKLMIAALEGAGLNPTRASLVDAMHSIGELDVAFEAGGTIVPGKGYLSDTARVYDFYGPGSVECTDLGLFDELGCWGPYKGDDPGPIPVIGG